MINDQSQKDAIFLQNTTKYYQKTTSSNKKVTNII